MYQDIDPANYGRVTVWAAKSLIGRVFLFYTDYYEKQDLAGIINKDQVRNYIDDVINHSGHDLVPEFKTLWRSASFVDGNFAGEDNIETVFAIKFTYKGYVDWDAKLGNGYQKFLGLRKGHYPYASGWGYCTVSPKLYDAYSEGDSRRDATIIDIKNEIPDFNSDDQRQYTGYGHKKFAATLEEDGTPTIVKLGGNDQIDGFDDIPAIRFADVLLMGAELHLDGGAKAQEYLDRVRDRAFQDAEHRTTVTKSAIMEERRLELALEGSRYWDLIRQSMEVTKDAIENDFVIDIYPPAFRSETRGFFSIPESQIQLSNGTLKQNEGWINQ